MLKRSSQRVQEALERSGVRCEVIELPESTRTAAAAAESVGCDVAQIAKSLVFRARESGRGVLVVASGANRVDETLVAQAIGEAIEFATADFVRETTGYAIGGVPPCGHTQRLEVLLDEDLFGWAELWAAAGTPNSLFRLSPSELETITSGRRLRIAN